MDVVTVRVPAKINLQLAVGPPEADGSHALATVFLAVSCFDEVTVRRSSEISVEVEGEQADLVPRDDTNLAVRAVRLMADKAGVEPRVALRIRKGIPVAGGMAGGSADGAAALDACDALWETHLQSHELHALASALGSDVPFLLVGDVAIGTGRGDVLERIPSRGAFHWVFAFAYRGLSTPEVYAECDRLRADEVIPQPSADPAIVDAIRTGDPLALGSALSNDLQAAACSLYPQLIDTLAVGEQYGALGSLVSGSGPTCAFLARDDHHAGDLAAGLMRRGTCRGVRTGRGPVAGAHVVGAEAAGVP